MVWRSLDAVVDTSPDRPETDSWPIVASGREIGSFVLLDPVRKKGDVR